MNVAKKVETEQPGREVHHAYVEDHPEVHGFLEGSNLLALILHVVNFCSRVNPEHRADESHH